MVHQHIMNVLPKRLISSLWARQETRISLSNLVHANNHKEHTPVATSASFLCNELPVRYTHILRLLSSLNNDTLNTPLIRHVAHRYLQDVCTMLQPSLQHTSPRAFSQTVKRLRKRQASSLIRLRYALTSSTTATPQSVTLMDHINAIGLGIHFLLDQHVSWHIHEPNKAQMISPLEIAQQAIHDARRYCGDTFGSSDIVPKVTIKESQAEHPLELTHIPSVLHRLIYEMTLLSLQTQLHHDAHQQRLPQGPWWQKYMNKMGLHTRSSTTDMCLDVFGGPTSIGFRLTSAAPLTHRDLQHDIPRDPMGLPTCGSILRQVNQMDTLGRKAINTHGELVASDPNHDLHEQKAEDDHLEWQLWSGWRMAKTLAGHFGGNLDIVSAEGLGSTMYLALDRDTQILERYPAILPSRSLSHQRYASSHLAMQHASSQLNAFLCAISDQSSLPATLSPPIHRHAVSLTAAVGNA
ncbi:hypothetical protein DM01DRAFT_1383412 [Hesseltinella vesiculosa]|uniref:Protein-serine/threonine kinase n=1 Tax=Hesseltinella vesiculosa TaxID=101127 RepID=A0A1X2GHU0_9FUNG|nr:hypothetical protein DM01DRAFT_1383412 [Hesseltinella vesiculosa]